MKHRIFTHKVSQFLFACFIFQGAQAVVPPPDGGYPGQNTAEGHHALLRLTTGTGNTAVGFISLNSNTTGSSNTAVGSGALLLNTANENTATGAGALSNNTTGDDNAANGAFALFSNTTGSDNTAFGWSALRDNTTGSTNIAIGRSALVSNASGGGNVAVGFGALASNTAVGVDSPDGGNLAIGFQALLNSNGTGDHSGGGNNAVGQEALLLNTTGYRNNAFGVDALRANTTGFFNTAMGDATLLSNATGDHNTAIGFGALANTITGSGNVALGANAGFDVVSASNVICLGAGVRSFNHSNTCYIGNIYGVTTFLPNAIPVLINSDGQLGTAPSSRRFKKDIKPMDSTSESILSLKPVTFHYKSDKTNTAQFGLIAEEVAEVSPGLVVHDKEGKPYSVRYDQVNAMLLNEFLKEHRKVEDSHATIAQLQSNAQTQEATIDELKKDVGMLATQLKDQAAKIQRVSAGLELQRPPLRTAAKDTLSTTN